MDKYTVNGVEIEFDTFDLFAIEAFQTEVERVRDVALSLDENKTIDGLFQAVEAMTDAFDVMCGEGTSYKLFGERTNVKEITDAYAEFTAAVKKRMAEASFFGTDKAAKPAGGVKDLPAPADFARMNREERRKMERQERRGAIEKRMAARHGG